VENAESFREFSRELILRFERSMRELTAELRAENQRTRDELVATREESRRHFEAQQDDMRDLREDSRAQTRALLRVLDRLDNGGGAAPAT
jgi:hypothetical protein